MPYIPHTDADVHEMLDVIGIQDTAALFDEIPPGLLFAGRLDLPAQASERAVGRVMRHRARQDRPLLCFAGGGAYQHHIPAAVWEIATRGEFYSAYTPYQAEASQGTMQVIYEYQSMMADLLAMEVANASLYDGASALGEALLMAVRANRRSSSKRILMPANINPAYRQVAANMVSQQGLEIIELPYCTDSGCLPPGSLQRFTGQGIAALVVSQPNYFGGLEDVDTLTDWAHTQGALVIALVNPLAMMLLEPPGTWGGAGADIAVGEGQPLGVPLVSGGPYFGFMACRKQHVRQMPGRIVGRTEDLDGKPCYALTLQAREQHIRRSKATSNICTNQGLMVTAATIHMAIMGPDGLGQAASASHALTLELRDALLGIDGIERVFTSPIFHECVLRLPADVEQVLARLAGRDILGGISLKSAYPELGEALLVCATENRTLEDIAIYVHNLREVLDDCRRSGDGARAC